MKMFYQKRLSFLWFPTDNTGKPTDIWEVSEQMFWNRQLVLSIRGELTVVTFLQDKTIIYNLSKVYIKLILSSSSQNLTIIKNTKLFNPIKYEY